MKVLPQPWRWLFRIFGISPCGNQKDKYFTAIAIIVMSGQLGFVIATDVKQPFSIIRWFITPLYLTATSWVIAYNYLCPEGFLEFGHNLRQVDLELNNLLKVKTETSSVSKTIVVWTIVIGLLLPAAGSFVLPLYLVARVWISNLFVHMPLLQLVLLANLVNNRFSVLNDRLASITIGPGTPSLLDRVFMIHSSLHAVVADIDIHFCFYTLLCYIAVFCTWVQHMYFILQSISGEVEEQPFYLAQYRMLFVTSHFILLALVCHSCSQAGNRTVLIAHRLLQPDTDPSIRDHVRLFSALATDNKVHFTIGGIFTLDRALVTKTALTALSYLIIAIQLRDVKVFDSDRGVSNTTAATPITTI